MAEMVMKDLVRKAGLENEFFIDSAACHTDEIGNAIHWGTRKKLLEKEIPFTDHRARLIKKSDYDDFDFIGNRGNAYQMIGNAVPPKLAKAIGNAIFELLEEVKYVSL